MLEKSYPHNLWIILFLLIIFYFENLLILKNTDIFVDALYSSGIDAISGGTLEGINTIGKVDVLDNFKMQLQETRKNTTDTVKIAEIDNFINRIDKVKSNPNLQEDLNQKINRYNNNNNVENSINNNFTLSKF